ncbi:XapX domain-containing protein [Maledivibacter halophilus]|uniref:XapX domain-containing protein n=1 Tax=Maledivibacter halophilus TaxID=36842 RepID=A0A1T5JZX4_9FIRM|nr:DUF1427 family protein [Maledivibacter halophilus]SKC56923.1 XapX domain-containing protein [Maledivibacter halophilus]
MKFSTKSFREIILSLMAGIVVGMVFKILKFPSPAPTNISGFMGIFGVWLGGSIVAALENRRIQGSEQV